MRNSPKHYTFFFLKCSVLLAVLLGTGSCGEFPKDTYGSLAEARNSSLLVGYTVNDPFVIENDSLLLGIEVEMVRAFAESIDAEVEWIHKNEQALLEDLKNRNLHLVVSGLTSRTPWKKEVGLTESYVTLQSQKHCIAVPPGEHALIFKLEEFFQKNEREIKELVSKYTEGAP